MSRMTVTVDDDLMAQAKAVLGVANKSEAIRIALRELLRQRRLAKILERQGTVELDLDPQTLAELREAP